MPNGDYLEISWEFEKISRFLRAMDCGALSGTEKPKLSLFGSDLKNLFYGTENKTLILRLENNLNLTIQKEKK